MVSIRPFKPEVAAVLALSWALPCPAAFIAPESHPLCHSKARAVVPVPHPTWSVRSRETDAVVRSQRPKGADNRVGVEQGVAERVGESPLPPLTLAPEDIHDSILEAFVQPHLKSKSYEPPRPPPQPQPSQPQPPQAQPVAVNGSDKAVQPGKAGAESPGAENGSGGSWWGKEWWSAITGGRNGTSNAQEDKGGKESDRTGEGQGEGARRRARRKGLHKNGHDVREGVRQLLRYKKKKDANAGRQEYREGEGKNVRVPSKGLPSKGLPSKGQGRASSPFSPSGQPRRPPAKPKGPFSPPASWSSLTQRALRRVAESPSVTWLANRLPRPKPPAPRSEGPSQSPSAPLLQRIMDPRSSPIFTQARSGFGRELRPDDLLKLPRNVEEAWDTIMDDTRHFFDSVYKALVPDTSRLEAPPTRPRVGLERPKAQRRRSGGLNAVPMALRESMSRQAAGKWAAVAGKAAQLEEEEEEEEEAEEGEEGEEEEEEEDWVAKVQRSLGASPSPEGQKGDQEEEGEGEGEEKGRRDGGDKGFVMRYPLALPTPPFTIPRPEVDLTTEARNPAPFPRNPAPAPAPAVRNPVRRAAEIERNSAVAVGEEQEDDDEEGAGQRNRDNRRGKDKEPPPPFVVPKGPKPKSWLDNLLQRLFASPDRALETARRRMLIRRVPRRMDERFLRTVSRKLQGDRLRIREFQLQTDRFRNSLLSAEAYYDAVTALFGSSENADEVLLPLIDTLPEQSKRRGLAEVYKARRAGQWGGGTSAVSSPREEAASEIIGPASDDTEEGGEEEKEGGGGFRAAVAGTVGNWWSATAGFTRNAWSSLANRSVEIIFEQEGEGPGEEGAPKEEAQVYEPFGRAREMLGERNVEYLRMRLDTFRRGGITAADFYRSLQRLCGPMPRVDAVMEEVGLELGDSARQWALLLAVHEGQKRSLAAGNGDGI